jgi:dolichyl-phosphate beta-glucosyltransferase
VHLSLVIPAYNEAERIGSTLHLALAYLNAQPYDSEVLVVDDGSRDSTREVVHMFVGGKHRTRVDFISYGVNHGKGYAVRTGMLDEARGEYRVFYDADASTPIEELEKLWPCFERGADIVIGSRSLPGADIEIHQAWYRETMGRVFNVLLRMMRLTDFKDTQCGFKGFTRRACDIVFSRQTVERFSFDPELLYIAQRHGLRIDEVPVRWLNQRHSRVHPLTDSARMFYDMLVIRWKALMGRYN